MKMTDKKNEMIYFILISSFTLIIVPQREKNMIACFFRQSHFFVVFLVILF